MKKLLLVITSLFVMTAGAFALDIKATAKKVESFYKSGSYIKTIDKELGTTRYYFKQHLTSIHIYSGCIDMNFYSGGSVSYYDNDYVTIYEIYSEDGNLVIVWSDDPKE